MNKQHIPIVTILVAVTLSYPVQADLAQAPKMTFAEALRAYTPMMGDEVEGKGSDGYIYSQGALLFAVWALSYLSWRNVVPRANETSFALVRKNPDRNRGKKMCITGIVVEIHEVLLNLGPITNGQMLTYNPGGYLTDVFSFIGVGSSEGVVENTNQTFCGIVTGTNDYTNSVGGTSHAVRLVGMFYIPQIRQSREPQVKP